MHSILIGELEEYYQTSLIQQVNHQVPIFPLNGGSAEDNNWDCVSLINFRMKFPYTFPFIRNI